MEDAWAHKGDEGRGKLRKDEGRSTHPVILRLPNGETRQLATTVTPLLESEPWELKHLSRARKRK